MDNLSAPEASLKAHLLSQLDLPVNFESSRNQVALRVAMRRAAHQLLDDPKIFVDPLALPVIGEEARSLLQSDLDRLECNDMARKLRAFFAVRSRYAEDELLAALARGVKQYVVCGAGLDTFAYRCRHGQLRIFEVDHPETQDWKKAHLRAARIPIPGSLAFVPIDLDEQTIGCGLERAGFSVNQPSFFSLLGLVPYLPRSRVMAILSYIASLTTPGSGVVFDYLPEPSSLSRQQQLVFEVLRTRVVSVGAPWLSYFAPNLLVSDLKGMGFDHVEEIDHEKLNSRYFPHRSDGLKVGRLARMICASVTKL